MKVFEAKSEKEALEIAAQELNQKVEDINYTVIADVKKLFGHKVSIGVYDMSDAIEYAVNYVETLCEMIEVDATAEASLNDDIINIDISSSNPSVVIGRNGENLRSLNELVRSAVFNKFGGHYRILLNCDNYKDDKYSKLIRIAKRAAYSVKKTGVKAVLDPMTSDERRVIHNALANDKSIVTVSEGSGHFRRLTISRVENSEIKEDTDTNSEEISD